MEVEIFKEASKIWSKFAAHAKDTDLQFSLEIHKKLLSFFHVGDYYYYIFNVKHSRFDLVSEEVTHVLGYRSDEIDLPFLLKNVHPDDGSWILKFEQKSADFYQTLTPDQVLNYKVRYDYRIRKKNGDYIRILQQYVPIETSDEVNVLRTFGIHTDITDIKKEGLPALSFIGINGEPSYHNISTEEKGEQLVQLTHRERQILSLIINGKKSEDIGKQLFISKQTVDTHRKKLLKKTNCSNMAALTGLAVKSGWV